MRCQIEAKQKYLELSLHANVKFDNHVSVPHKILCNIAQNNIKNKFFQHAKSCRATGLVGQSRPIIVVLSIEVRMPP